MKTKKLQNIENVARSLEINDPKSPIRIEIVQPATASDGFEPFPFGTVAEGHQGKFEFRLVWTDGQPRDFGGSVDFSTQAQTATSGSDYTESSGTLTIPAGQALSNLASIPILNDNEDEPDETYLISLTNPIRISIAPSFTATITDTLRSAQTNTLPAKVENLTLTGTGNIDGTGNAGKNTLTGNSGKNTLSGLGGNDKLIGKGGQDSLLGGNGNDTYQFDSLQEAFGTVIEDTEGNRDKLILSGLERTRIEENKVGFDRQGTTLVVDTDKDGKIDLAKDLSVKNFFETETNWEKGTGYIETVGNLPGQKVLNLFALEGRETVRAGSEEKKVWFEVSGYPSGRAPDSLVQKWDNKPVWIVSHGLQSDPVPFRQLAANLQAKTGATVLLLNWSEAAKSSVNPATVANTWIQSVAKFAVDKLKAWGLTSAGSNLNLAGHSLGTLLSNQIGTNLSGINALIALDPPSESAGSYNIRPNFAAVSEFSRAFVGNLSISGNSDFAATADEAYVMDFGNTVPSLLREHSRVHQTFAKMLTGNRQLINGLLPFSSKQTNPAFQPNAFRRSLYNSVTGFEGIIKVNSENEPLSLTAKRAGTVSEDDLIYGSTGDDQVSGIFKGFKPLVGGAGNDTLTGGAGADDFVFDIGTPFNSSIGVDTITDFGNGADRIILKRSTFTTLELGNLRATNFAKADSPGVSPAKIVLTSNGSLYYNPDGSAAGLTGGGLFARLQNGAALSAGMIQVQA